MPSAKKKPTGRTTAKNVATKRVDVPRFEPPLNATCEMAWRIASTHPEFLTMLSEWMTGESSLHEETFEDAMRREEDIRLGRDPESPLEFGREPASHLTELWRDALLLADIFVGEGQSVISLKSNYVADCARKRKILIDLIDGNGRTLKIPGTTSLEKENGWISYRRACKIITGVDKAKDAEERFDRVFTEHIVFPKHIQREAKLQPLDFYREYGFPLLHVGLIRDAWLKLPEEALRKTYEKSGRYRRNKQGRKKNPKK